MARKKKDGLPPHIYARGQRLYMRILDASGKWVNKPTPYAVDQVDKARRFVQATLRGTQQLRDDAVAGRSKDATFAVYAQQWLKERIARGLPSAMDDRSRISHAVKHIGHLQMDEVRPRHLRDMVRALKALTGDDKLAPRTIRHVFMTTHNIFENARVDELIESNPAIVKTGELPRKIDADPEWRGRATFATAEVEQLISDAVIPAERRVMYALKAITGERHGEVAALCWRHLDYTHEPLAKIHIVQSHNSRLNIIKSTKSEETREVPMHPTLAKILAAWKKDHWPRIYGRKPTPDDFVVPTRTFKCVSVKDANEAFKRDLRALGLRVDAGKLRDRGGHDLRSWYETRLIEDGADSLLVRRTTHARPKDVSGGYERFSWKTICREVAKLKVRVLGGKVLPLVPESLQAEAKARGRWHNSVTPLGLEPYDLTDSSRTLADDHRGNSADGIIAERTGCVTRGTKTVESYGETAARLLEQAVREGDGSRVLEIATELRGLRSRNI